MTPEGKIEKHLKKAVEASGGKVRKVKWIGKSGAPDRIMWWPGPHARDPMALDLRFAFVELKAPGKKPTKVQEIEHKALRDDGWTVLVVDSIQAADAAILLVRDKFSMTKFHGQIMAQAEPKEIFKSKSTAPKYDVKTPADLPALDNSDLA